MDERRFKVDPDEEGDRLDRVLARRLGISRRLAIRAIEEGKVRVGGRRAAKGYVLAAGEEIVAEVPTDLAPLPEPRALRVLYEDEWILAVDKPAGWPMHPLRPGETGTLANAVVAREPACARASADPREGGAAHRLDNETSGVVLFARSRPVWMRLREMFAVRAVHKEYLALVRGAPEAGEIRRPILPASASRSRVARSWEEGREALTRVEPLEFFDAPGQGRFALVRCTIPTGVRHQIRVHLQAIGHPIAGDALYGGARLPGLERLFLHATAIVFDHPVTGRRLRVESPLPEELRAVLAVLTRGRRAR